MTETFVENLASAACQQNKLIDAFDEKILNNIIIAILRAARKPSEGMCAAGTRAGQKALSHAEVYAAMIDHALAEHEQKNEDAA